MWGFKRRIGSASQITTMTMLSLAKAFLLKQGFACTAKKPRSTAPSSLQKAQPDSRSAAQFRFPDSRGQWAHMKMKKKSRLVSYPLWWRWETLYINRSAPALCVLKKGKHWGIIGFFLLTQSYKYVWWYICIAYIAPHTRPRIVRLS